MQVDADALGEAIVMVSKEGKPESVLDMYSDARRKVFQYFVDPTSTYNKLRIHSMDQDVVARDDWYFRSLQNPSMAESVEAMKPYFEVWRTDMRKIAKEQGL